MDFLYELLYWLTKTKDYLERFGIGDEHKLILIEIDKRLKELTPILIAQNEEDYEV
jgi:hypothetical protein